MLLRKIRTKVDVAKPQPAMKVALTKSVKMVTGNVLMGGVMSENQALEKLQGGLRKMSFLSNTSSRPAS